jgi:hypothetical protein
MATTAHTTRDRLAADDLEQITSEADDGAARLAMDIESIADEAEILSRGLADLRVDLAKQRLLLDDLSRCRR